MFSNLNFPSSLQFLEKKIINKQKQNNKHNSFIHYYSRTICYHTISMQLFSLTYMFLVCECHCWCCFTNFFYLKSLNLCQMLQSLRTQRNPFLPFNLDRAHVGDATSTDVILSNYIASLLDFICNLLAWM